MAAGDYVSASSQADTEAADVAKEMEELRGNLAGVSAELAAIYVRRGLPDAMAPEVAARMLDGDAFAVPKSDELGMTADIEARPVQAALVSAVTFAGGASLPLAIAYSVPEASLLGDGLGCTCVGGNGCGGLGVRDGSLRPVPEMRR